MLVLKINFGIVNVCLECESFTTEARNVAASDISVNRFATPCLRDLPRKRQPDTRCRFDNLALVAIRHTSRAELRNAVYPIWRQFFSLGNRVNFAAIATSQKPVAIGAVDKRFASVRVLLVFSDTSTEAIRFSAVTPVGMHKICCRAFTQAVLFFPLGGVVNVRVLSFFPLGGLSVKMRVVVL